MPPRLSVVVPVYNVELYLTDCLKSLAEQTMDDLEVVMVDDGSTDGSAAWPPPSLNRTAGSGW